MRLLVRLPRRCAAISIILAMLLLVGSIPATAMGVVTSTIPVGPQPLSVAVSPDGSTAYVTHLSANMVSVLDVASSTVTSTIAVGSQPRGVAFTPDGSTAYATNSGSGSVSVIDVASGTVISTVPVGAQPYDVAFTPDGSTAYVANYASSTVSVITVALGTVAFTIPVGANPRGVAFTPDGTTAYVTNNNAETVSAINVASRTVTSTIPVGTAPFRVTFTPDGSIAYVTNTASRTVSVITVASGTVTSTIPVGFSPTGVAFTPDGLTAYVANHSSHTLSVINVNATAPVFTAATPPDTGTIGTAYSYTFTASGNPAPRFTVFAGSLPEGLTLDAASGVLSGTPAAAGEYTFTVRAANGISPAALTPSLTIAIAAAEPSDTTDPTITIASPIDGSEVVQGAVLNASYACADESAGSGLASCTGTVASGTAIDTSVVGEKSFTVTATDTAGNMAVKMLSYRVVWQFSGFAAPVDALPTLNATKAGSVVPMRFSLDGDRGLDILAAGYPTTAQIGCDPSAPLDLIEETALSPGANTLSYDTATGQYAYNWKTNKAWKNTCRQLTFKLADGASYRANFRFS